MPKSFAGSMRYCRHKTRGREERAVSVSSLPEHFLSIVQANKATKCQNVDTQWAQSISILTFTGAW